VTTRSGQRQAHARRRGAAISSPNHENAIIEIRAALGLVAIVKGSILVMNFKG
jgi:hypothetical protein